MPARPSDVLAQVASPGSFDPSRAVDLSLRAGEPRIACRPATTSSGPMTIEAPRPGLEAAQRERFARDGFLFPFRVLSREAADVARGRVLSLLDEHDEDPELDDYLGYKANLVFRWVDDIVHETCLLDAVEDLLGPDLLLWSCSLLLKPPHSRGRYTWHQDATYWGMEPPSAVSAWLALGDVGPENGGLRCLPGLHARGQLAHENTFAEDVMLPRGQELRDLDQDTIDSAADIRLQSGEASFHHVFTPHSSGPNRSGAWRIGLQPVFIPTSVRHRDGRESAMLVRGRDDFGHFESEPRPRADRDPAARAAHRAAMTRMGTWRAEQRLHGPGARHTN